jgi:hypothetical protein
MMHFSKVRVKSFRLLALSFTTVSLVLNLIVWVGLASAVSTTFGPAGGEFLVNTLTTNDQTHPSIAMDADGNFVVVWRSLDGSGSGIRAQRYNSAGVPQGSEFSVKNSGNSSRDVAMDADGNFVVVWRIGKIKALFKPPPPAACLRRRPLPARGAGGSPSTQRRPAVAACSQAWRGNARPGHAGQVGLRSGRPGREGLGDAISNGISQLQRGE